MKAVLRNTPEAMVLGEHQTEPLGIAPGPREMIQEAQLKVTTHGDAVIDGARLALVRRRMRAFFMKTTRSWQSNGLIDQWSSSGYFRAIT